MINSISAIRTIVTITGLLISSFSATPQLSGANDDVEGPSYNIDLTDVINHYVTVTMTAQASDNNTILMIPTWTPGSYLMREYAKHIDRIEVIGPRNQALSFEKVSKNRWQVKTRRGQEFSVKYRIFCKERSVRTNWVSYNYAILNGAATFITIDGQRDRPHSVELTMPQHWLKSATSLLPFGDRAHQYRAADYDELVDSPIVAGNLDIYPFKVANVEHYLVNVNEMGTWDGPATTRDLKTMIETHHRLWDCVPYDRYYFLNVIGGGGGGLEHDNSCLIMTGQFAYRSATSYQRWLTLASHEFFHTWNIRRLRPKALVKYDYESEVYTPSLWIAEGVTSYYEKLLLVRAGLMTQRTFVSGLGDSINRLQRTDGRLVQSLRDASHDAWIKFYRPEDNSSETTISYYSKGAIVAFLLDAEIRSATEGNRSLDDVLRRLYQEHSGNTGYSPADFRRICSEVADVDLTEWFARSVDSTEELDYQTAIDWYGLKIGPDKPDADNPAADSDRRPQSSQNRSRPWIGIGQSGSPASRAGLAASDEVIAVNGFRITSNIDSHIQQFKVGDLIKVLVARDGKIEELVVAIGNREPTPDWSVSVSDKASVDQKANLAALLSPQPKLNSTENKEQTGESDTTTHDETLDLNVDIDADN